MNAPTTADRPRSRPGRVLRAALPASLVLTLLAAVGVPAAGAAAAPTGADAAMHPSPDRLHAGRADPAPDPAAAVSSDVAEEAEGDPAGSTMMPGDSLSPGESITSPNGRYQLILQHDGNLVLYDSDGPVPLWDSRTVGRSDRTLIMQADGNLVLYELPVTPYDALWHSRTHGRPGAFLTVRDDGTMTIGDSGGSVLWTAGTSTPAVGLTGAKHIVYGVGEQRVWLVEADGSLRDTYPVSGRAGTPAPGRYRVFSKSVNAWSFTPGVTMKHMVRFARGRSGAAIGFHSIPNDRWGTPIQTTGELGQYRSAGCVRQHNDKARRLYEWAPIGTPVAVVA